MLQNRKFKLVLMCLVIAIAGSEQRQQQVQGQIQGRRNNQQLQQQQAQQQPQVKQIDPRLIQEREYKAREMLKFMNLEGGDACKDFYDFACGNWLQQQNTEAASDGDFISVQGEMQQMVNKQLIGILNEPISSLDPMSTKVAKDFYRTCLRVPASSPAQRQFIYSFVLENGGLPDIKGTQWQANYNWMKVIADLRRNYGLDILIGLTIDRSNPNHKVIYIEEPKTTVLPVELCSSLATPQWDENSETFNKIQNEIRDNLMNWFDSKDLNQEDALRIAGAIVRFEFDLCKYMRTEQTASTPLDTEQEEQINLYTMKCRAQPVRTVENKMHGVRQSSSNSMQSLRTLSENCELNLKYFVDHSLETETFSQVQFRSEEYFEQLRNISKKGLQPSFANYIMYRALSEINFPLKEAKGQRPVYCANQIMRYLPQVLSKLYHDKYNYEEAKKGMEEMFFLIKQGFARYLQTNVEWMTENTKRAIKQKLNTLKLSYPTYPQNLEALRGIQLHDDQDYWHRLQAIMMYNANQTVQQIRFSNDPSNFLEAPAVSIQQKPNAYELVVGYGLLQKPFYSQFYSNSLKYSSIGVALAREMIKIFDYQGFQQSLMSTFPWDSVTTDNFPIITECFRAQMSNYFYNSPNLYRNATKLREIMVETSAVNVAFNAYLIWLEQAGRQRADLQLETLPGMDFTNTQLFFINFAQNRCAAHYNVELLPEFLPLYRRSMEQFDINGPLSNNVEFGRDFACEVGSDMSLDDKCVLY